MYFLVTSDESIFFWQLKKNDGTAIAQAMQNYDSLAHAMTDINLIKKWAPTAETIITIIPPFGGPPPA
jgi:uncharacterized protein YegP (UPF0339 family)